MTDGTGTGLLGTALGVGVGLFGLALAFEVIDRTTQPRRRGGGARYFELPSDRPRGRSRKQESIFELPSYNEPRRRSKKSQDNIYGYGY